MTTLLLDWPAARAAGPKRAGGKGWQLAELDGLGVSVPPGFVIDASNGFGRRHGDALPQSLVIALSRELEKRGWSDVPLAVRSSASTEDSARASFAGIYRSRLNVRGLDAVVRAVQEVWDSAWESPAVAYRQRFDVPDTDAAMAVIVMPLLPAIASGIAFTCDPVSGREDHLVIHANWGLGESLVGGHAEGDEYRLQESYPNDDLVLIAQHRGSKARTSVAIAHGGTELRETSVELARQPVLSAGQAIALGEIVRDVASVLDYARPFYDVEWVWDGHRFWIVQARPVTARTRYTYPALMNQPALWSRGNSRDVVPEPFSAMDWSVNRALLTRMLTRTSAEAGFETLPGLQRTALRNGRLYFETSILQWEAFDGFDVQPKTYNQLLGGHQPQISVPKAALVQRMARAKRSVRFLLKCVRPRLEARAVLARAHQEAAERLANTHQLDNVELAKRLRMQILSMRSADDLFLLQAAVSALFVLLDLLEKHCPGEGHALTASLMAGGEPSVTAAQSYELMELARIAAEDRPALEWLRCPNRVGSEWSQRLSEASPFRRAFADFLRRYGHRAVYESYLRNPRWRETPDYLLDSIVNLTGYDGAQVRARQQKTWIEARRRLARELPFWHRPLISMLVKFAVVERNIREGARSALVAHAGVVRSLLLVIEERFEADVFNLTLPEVLALAEGRMSASVAATRAGWRRQQLEEFGTQTDPEVIVEHGEEVLATGTPAIADANLWQGTVVSSGYARGVAHVARHPTEALHMSSGAILVAPSTDPSWTPIFLKAGALVMETGGYISHGAIVAREFGIPAVVNLPGILDEIKTGDLLEIDATRGVVRRLQH